MNGKCFSTDISLQFGAAFNHYTLWELVWFLVQHCFVYFLSLIMNLLTKEIICCSFLCPFLMSFVMSSIFRCNSPPEMISSYP